MRAISRATPAAAGLGLALAIGAAGSCGEERDQEPDLYGPEAEKVAAGLIEMGTERPPQATRCSVRADHTAGAGPVVHGWRRDYSHLCCGMAKCIDRAVCGDDYGQSIWRCGDCNYYDCTYRPGEFRDSDAACHWDPGRTDDPRRLPP